jgi:diketogulonate reductase-like aldo/keto reductase
MNALTDSYVLHNGVKIPCVGFGTWQTPDGEVAVSSVRAALDAGYRHIDTAAVYGNEQSVGKAIRQSGIDRKALFITTKLWNDSHSYDKALKAFDESMDKLGLEYLDLYLIHWPNPVMFRDRWEQANAEAWKAMEELYEAGRIRAIGISNFRVHHMEALLKTAKVKPMVNQIRLCPGETQDDVVAFSREQDMLLQAYSPMGVGKIFEVPQMQALAEKYKRSIAQICLRWSLQRGYLPLPKSVTPSRIAENTKLFDFELSKEDVALIAGMKGVCGYSQDPDTTTF